MQSTAAIRRNVKRRVYQLSDTACSDFVTNADSRLSEAIMLGSALSQQGIGPESMYSDEAASGSRATTQLNGGVQMMKNAIYRQGDVLIRRIQSLPKQKAQPRLTGILAYGEVTGHAHKVEDLDRAEVLEVGSGLFLRVGEEGVRIIHEEHAAITLPAGNYEVEIQREYTPAEIRNVAD